MANDLTFVREVTELLERSGVRTVIFGGWAEELCGVAAPREHDDLDLLYPAPDFSVLDALIDQRGFAEIVGKRFPHKRAIIIEGVMVEFVLVERDGIGDYTLFWGETRHDWPPERPRSVRGLVVAAPEVVASYRSSYEHLKFSDE